MNPHDHPDLTAHVLGELDAEHAEAMAQWIAENPAARAEAEDVGKLSTRLKERAFMPLVSLHAHQREAILSGPQLVRKMVEVAAQKQKQRSSWMPVFSSLGRIAAAAVLLIGGFVAGTRFTQQTTKPSVAKTEPSSTKPNAAPQEPFRAKEVQNVAQSDGPKEAPAVVHEVVKPVIVAPPVKQEEIVVATIPPSPEPAKELVKPARVEMKVIDEAMIPTTKNAIAQVSLQPAKTRPVVTHTNQIMGVAPLTGREKSVVAVPAKKAELLIHSWKAEIASCPWDESRRLIRLSIQMPGEQSAAHSDRSYPMQIAFQQGFVRSYRQLSQRVVPAPGASESAWHVAWFEFVPNGNPADALRGESGRIVASVTLPNAKFTMPAMGPFDTGASTLQVVDHGTTWNEASDDFLFESSVTGFGLLLKGATISPALNHSLVLKLADRTLKDDRNGERARFVKLVKDAQKTAGL